MEKTVMSAKRPRQSGGSPPPLKGDNFKLITGISGLVEARLHKAGILAYAQLAASPLEDLLTIVGKIPGVSAEKIVQQQWIEKAREIALKNQSAASYDNAAGKAMHTQYATFDTELRLSSENEVLQTRVLHVQTGDEEEWSGWQTDDLIKFFSRYASLPAQALAPLLEIEAEEFESENPEPLPSREPAAPEAVEVIEEPSLAGETAAIASQRDPASPASEAPAIEAELASPQPDATSKTPDAQAEPVETRVASLAQPSKIEIALDKVISTERLISRAQRLDVHLRVELSTGAAPDEPLDYLAILQALELSSGTRFALQASGEAHSQGLAPITFDRVRLMPGTYLLRAFVRVNQQNPRGNLLDTVVEGGLLQIY
jgi:hypothetical protein